MESLDSTLNSGEYKPYSPKGGCDVQSHNDDCYRIYSRYYIDNNILNDQ